MSEKKKKILIRIGSLRHGGAEKVLSVFLKNLPQNKYEIDLLLNLYSGKYLPEIPSWINVLYLNKGEMITTNRLPDIPEKAYRVVYQSILKKFPKILYHYILKKKKYDIEFAAIHELRDEILNSPLKSSKKIIWIHNDLSQLKGYNEFEIKKFFGYDKIMVISQKIANLFQSLAGSPMEENKIERIYNPLDREEILEKSKEKFVENVFGDSVPVFISIGTVFPQKGFDRLLKVHRKLIDQGFLHRILIIGDGYDFENIQALKEKLNLNDTVKMLGFVNNPYPYLREADYFMLSSRYEGFPTVLFEAITLKKKIIATDVSGVREMLNDGKLGMIVGNSEEGIYEGMKRALTAPEEFNEYLIRMNRYEIPFDLRKAISRIVGIIDKL